MVGNAGLLVTVHALLGLFQHPLDLRKVWYDLDGPIRSWWWGLHLSMIAEQKAGVLENVAGEHRDHAVGPFDLSIRDELSQPRQGHCAGRLTADSRGVDCGLGLQ